MHRLVTAGRPAGALLQPQRVIGTADQNLGPVYCSKWHLQAKIGVPLHQQFGIDRAVRVVAGRAAFAQRLMFKNVTALAAPDGIAGTCHFPKAAPFRRL